MRRLKGPFPGVLRVDPPAPYAGKMPTLCANGGPLPESLRRFVGQDGELRCGDAVGLEAAWILSEVTIQEGNYCPEDDYSATDQDADRTSEAATCASCGAEDVQAVDGECSGCSVALPFVVPEHSKFALAGWEGWAPWAGQD